MSVDAILAVVVSFNGRQKTLDTLRALIPFVEHVHVVDNASGAESVALLDEFAQQPGVTVEYLDRNRGVGYALNRGVARGRELGVSWLLTMDQDSIVDVDMIPAYRRAIHANPALVSLTPNVQVRDRRALLEEGAVDFAITSGNLVRMDLFRDVGAFDEELFIDGVDIDFCLRLRWHGYGIERVRDAVLYHELGAPNRVPTWAGRFYMAHSPIRRYYMYRNHLYLVRRYWSTFPWFMLKATAVQFVLLVCIVIWEEGRGQSLRFALRGAQDFFQKRVGAFVAGSSSDLVA